MYKQQTVNLQKIKLYPSQTPRLKEIAKLIATSVTKYGIKISAFKRNDYLAEALGYKGFSDLIQSSKFRADSDKNRSPLILSRPECVEAIAYIFSRNTVGLSSEQVGDICLGLKYVEYSTEPLIPLHENDIVVIKSSPGAFDKESLVAKLVPDSLIIKGSSIRHELGELDYNKILQAKYGVVGVVEAQRITSDSLNKLATMAFEHNVKLLISTQVDMHISTEYPIKLATCLLN